MFLPDGNVRVWLCTLPTDMRKSFNGLSAMVRRELQDNPLSGHLYVFVNRKRTLMKILYFDGDGYAVWSKRLEQGQFHLPDGIGVKKPLNYGELQCLLYGIDWQHAQRYKRFSLPNQQAA